MEDNAIQSIIVHEDKIRTVFTVITEYCTCFNRFRLLHCSYFYRLFHSKSQIVVFYYG